MHPKLRTVGLCLLIGALSPPLYAETDEVEAPSAQTQPEETERASVIVVVFIEGMGPAPEGVVVETDDGSTATTTGDGVARLSVLPGTRSVVVMLPEATLAGQTTALRVDVTRVVLDAGGSAQVLVNLDASGALLNADVEGTQATNEEEDEPAPEEVEVVVLGTITGVVISAEDKTPIADVLIIVLGVETEVRTDVNGRFSIRVPSGTQAVSVLHTQFSTETKGNVEVPEEGTVNVEFQLTPAASQLDDVVITAPHIQGGVADVMSDRRKSPSVQDALGSEDIEKTGDGSASSASRRIVGASVVGGQFLLVRGLGGRYSNVRLNGVPLPSTDPDLPGFQLDLFPTSLLSSLTITKTFSPDIPGDFAGGSMNIETKTFPEDFTLTFSAGTSYNTETTGRDILGSPGGETDYLGYDDGTRALPDSVPEARVAITPVRRGQEPPPGALTRDDVTEISRGFPNAWLRRRQTAYPNLSLGFSVGDTFDLGRAGRIGYLATGGYKYNYERYNEIVTNIRLEGTGDDRRLAERETLSQEVGEEEALMGGLGTVSYSPWENHALRAIALATLNGVDKTSLLTGFSDEEGSRIERTTFQYVQRRLLFYQLLGKHEDLSDILSISWQLNTAEIERSQPDTRYLLYQQRPNSDEFALRSIPGSGERQYTDLEQTDYGGGLDLTFQLVEDGAAKLGYMGRTSERVFAARRFTSSFMGTDAERSLPPDELFDPEQAGVLFTFTEATRPTDGYRAEQLLHAGYGMLEIPVLQWLRAMAGVRVESFSQLLSASSPFAPVDAGMDSDTPNDDAVDRQDVDYLPAGSLIFGLSENMNLRGAYGGTVARPQVKELAPFITQDYVRRRQILGNPELLGTFIHNFDLRWETFPTPTEVFAVSLFYKAFEDPIESVIISPGGDISYENVEGASNYGIELEARVGLELIHASMDEFSVLANLALIRSEVELSVEQQRVATSQKRPLAGQSPFVANLGAGYEPEDLGFSAYVFYNVFGRRIDDVGRLGLPDVYEEAFHSVDASVNYEPIEHFTIGVSGSNLLFSEERFTQGGLNSSRAKRGATFGLSAGLDY